MKCSRKNRRSIIPHVSAICALALCLIPTVAQSKTIYVPADSATLQAGIDGAVDGDTVLVAPGLYTGPGNEGITFGGKNIVLKSEAGAEATTLLTTTDSLRTIIIESGEDSTCIVDGFTVSGGYENDFDWSYPYQGGISIDNSSPVIRSCIISGSYFLDGGGIHVNGGSPVMGNCQIIRNRAKQGGGGIWTNGSDCRIESCQIRGNSAGTAISWGGGLALYGGYVTIIESNICHNRVGYPYHYDIPQYGGGIYNVGSRINILGTTIAHNSATQGGAILSRFGILAIRNSLIYNNVAGSRAGLAMMDSPEYPDEGLLLLNCTIACNYGAHALSDGISVMPQFDFPVSNFGSKSGFAKGLYEEIDSLAGRFIINDNIFAFNASAAFHVNVDGISLEVAHNNVWHTVTGPDYGGLISDQTGINGNISVDPLFCSVGDVGFGIDSSSVCRNAGTSGDYIGAFSPQCNLYSGNGPKRVIAILVAGGNSGINQDSIDAAMARADPWDTLRIDYKDDLTSIDRLLVDKPLYIIGNGIDINLLLRSLTPDTLGNTICVDIRNFCVFRDFNLYAIDMPGNVGDTSGSIKCSGETAIITNCRTGAFSYLDESLELGIAVCSLSSPLIRNCSFFSVPYKLGVSSPSDVVVSNCYWWEADGEYSINQAILDGRDEPGSGFAYYIPFLTEEPTDIDDMNHGVLILPESYLSQNRPNPFNGSTSISYYLPRSGHARLEIYNILGQRVKIVYEGIQSAGWHSHEWNGRDERGNAVATGVYMYKLTFDSEISTKKMMYLK